MSTDDTTPTDEPSDDKIQSLERRVAELEAMTEVDSADGGGVSLPDLLELGLTRRQALMAIALVGAGYSLGPAITKSISEPAAASHGGATLGTADDPLEAIYVEDLNQTTDNIVTDSLTADALQDGIVGSGRTLTDMLGPGMALHKGELVSYLQIISKSVDVSGSYHWREDGGSDGMWSLVAEPGDANTVELMSAFGGKQGTASDPFSVEWEGRVIGEQSDLTSYMGLAESWVSGNQYSIFLRDNNGTIEFMTNDGQNNSTLTDVSASIDPTSVQTYRVEWTDEPRATLYYNGTQIAEHTTNVPMQLLHPFLELAYDAGTSGLSSNQVWASEELFTSFIGRWP